MNYSTASFCIAFRKLLF